MDKHRIAGQYLTARRVDLIEEFVFNYLRHQAVNSLYGCLAAKGQQKQKGLIKVKHITDKRSYFKNKHIPVSCCLGQFVLRFTVVCVQTQHEASSA